MSTLHEVLRARLRLSDAEFAALCSCARTQIHGYRTGGRYPGSKTAAAILSALKRLGVEMTLEELLSKPPRPRRSRRAA